jgi:MFS transporter, DHA2 family, methylenomycin A resistance protein
MATAKTFPIRVPNNSTLVLLATSLGVLVAQVDTSVVNLAVKHIGADLGSTISGMQWIVDAYNLVYAALLLTAGVLGDLYGRRHIFVYGLSLFAAGSIVCAAAPNTGSLLAGRAITGLGAALELPMSLVLLTLAYPEEKSRQRALGLWASCYGLAFVVGPTLGGFLVDTVGWRSIFYMVLPLCAAAILLARYSSNERSRLPGRHLDIPGQAAAVIALSALSFAAIEGAHLGWSSILVLAATAIGVIAVVGFAFVERRNVEGLVPFNLFQRAAFSASLAIAGMMTFGMYALLFLMPLYFQTVRGRGVLGAGLEMLPLSIAYVLVSQWNGKIVQAAGARWTMAAGMAAMGVGELACAPISASTNGWYVSLALCVVGVGLGLNTAPVNNVAISNAPRSRAGTASGLINTSRMVGATLGVAILGALFAWSAGQAPSAETFGPGLRAALGVGGTVELLGAFVAAIFIRHDSTVRTLSDPN